MLSSCVCADLWIIEKACVCRFYARTSRLYVELDQSVTSKDTANFLDGHKKRATRPSLRTNDPNAGDVTADHVTIGNGQYFVLDADAVNREAFLSSQ